MGGSDQPISITEWLDLARTGDENSFQQLWQRYYERLVRLANARLPSHDRRVLDEEDVVVDAFQAFFRALEKGALQEITDREGLWRVLVTIADNKVSDQIKYQRRQKRGGGQVRGHSFFLEENRDRLNELPDPSSDFAEEFGLVCRERLTSLRSDLRQVAIWKMEGYSNKEIAGLLGCVEESVRRKVILIRSQWTDVDE
jgi:RNA polymerase sigma factor (sigma-70 family)